MTSEHTPGPWKADGLHCIFAGTPSNPNPKGPTMKIQPNNPYLIGHAAIAYAEQHDLLLNKFADPTEEGREGLTLDEAREIAREDDGLIWIAPAQLPPPDAWRPDFSTPRAKVNDHDRQRF